jgi:hypothetical protein
MVSQLERGGAMKLSCSLGLSLVLSIMMPLSAGAAGSAFVQSGHQTTQLFWQDGGNVRIGADGAPNYMLMRSGKAYLVSFEQGKPLVMQADSMVRNMISMSSGLQNGRSIPKSVESIVPTGASETVAGIPGHVYRLTVLDTQGRLRNFDAVLSNDVRAVNMTQAYLGAIQLLLGDNLPANFLAALPADQRGILRLDHDFVLRSISSAQPIDTLFALPAQPISLDSQLLPIMRP